MPQDADRVGKHEKGTTHSATTPAGIVASPGASYAVVRRSAKTPGDFVPRETFWSGRESRRLTPS